LALILNIETATKNCSVSLGQQGKQIDIIEYTGEGYSHAEKLHVFIRDILKRNNFSTTDLSAVAVSKGPGSYTGLRIGVSAAKGLAYALEIPLISVSTLQSLALQIEADDVYIIPMIDARRMEVYAAVFDNHYQLIRKVQADILSEDSYSEFLSQKKTIFLGDAIQKARDVLKHDNAVFIGKTYPSAKEMIVLSYNKLQQNDFENVAYFEPFYLKDFITTNKK